jgi:hypothetical protein
MHYLLKQRHWMRLRLENKNRQFQTDPLPPAILSSRPLASRRENLFALN